MVGVVLAAGDPTSHGVQVLGELGVPVVTGAGPALLAVAEGTPLAVDAGAGSAAPAGSPAG